MAHHPQCLAHQGHKFQAQPQTFSRFCSVQIFWGLVVRKFPIDHFWVIAVPWLAGLFCRKRARVLQTRPQGPAAERRKLRLQAKQSLSLRARQSRFSDRVGHGHSPTVLSLCAQVGIVSVCPMVFWPILCLTLGWAVSK